MKFLWLIIALIIPFLSHGQMLFSGEIARNTHWSGNILLEGDVIVKKGVTLTIAPGSRIRISANRDKTNSGKDPERIEIIVIGNLFANGKSNDGQITFTSSAEAPKIKDWYGIVFKNRVESSMLNNCIIEYGYKGITCYGSSPELVNCEIRFNFYGGISAEVRSHPLIKSCILRGNEFAGLICELASNPIVEKTLITQNEYGVLIFDRSQPQLGSVNKKKPGSAGANRIFNNFNLNIYNRSSEQIFAQNNIWNVDNNGEIVNKILDKTDEPAYGEVVFKPIFRNKPSRVAPKPPVPQSQLSQANSSQDDKPQVEENTVDTLKSDTPTDVFAGKGAKNSSLPKQSANAARSDTITSFSANPDAETSAPALNKIRDLLKNEPIDSAFPSSPKMIAKNPKDEKMATLPNLTPDQNLPVKEPVLEALLDGGSRHYVHRAKPKYPEIYQRTGHEGKVLMEVVVDRSGAVESYKVLRSDGVYFTNAAIEAIEKMRYRPETLQGKPVKFTIIEPFYFKLH